MIHHSVVTERTERCVKTGCSLVSWVGVLLEVGRTRALVAGFGKGLDLFARLVGSVCTYTGMAAGRQQVLGCARATGRQELWYRLQCTTLPFKRSWQARQALPRPVAPQACGDRWPR